MPTDWESRYRENDTPWDKGMPSPGLVDFLKENRITGKVLSPGCGFGHDLRAIALSAGGDADVLGLDIAPSAVEGAQAATPADLPGLRFELGDFFALPEPFHGAFDWIWEHTCFCAIDPDMRAAYAKSVATALKPGGQFLAVFYLEPGLDPNESGPPFGATLSELDALFGPSLELLRDWVPQQTYPGREGREHMRLYRKSV